MKDAYYFSHDSNAFQDPKIIKMIMDLEIESYGIYWVIIENLRNEHSYKLHDDDIPTIAYQCRCDEAKVKQIINKYKLFEFDGEGHFYSPSLMNRMEVMEVLRGKRQDAGRKGGMASSKAKAMLNNCSSSKVKESKVKEKKVKEIKENKKKVFTKPTFTEIRSYCLDRKNGIDAQYWLDKQNAIGWVIGKNRSPMQDWKASIRTWEKNNYKVGPDKSGLTKTQQLNIDSMQKLDERLKNENASV